VSSPATRACWTKAAREDQTRGVLSSRSLTPATHDREFAALLGEVASADAPEDKPSLRPGRQVGDVVLKHAIGRGGMGEVWEAWHKRLGRDVAIKMLLHGTEDGLAEAVVLERLRHPNVVEVHGFGELDGVPFVVMERLRGDTLRKRIDRRGPMTPREGIALTQQLAAALSHAHGHGVVHRDVKPSNVIVVGAEQLEVKLIDFGLSRLSPRLSDEARELGRAGTPAYMSPEQRRAPEAIDGRSDLWSATAVVFFALTGHRPDANEPTQLPEAVGHWIGRGMHDDIQQRPATPHQWAHSYKRAVERGGAPLPYPQALYEMNVDVERGVDTDAPAPVLSFAVPRWAKLLISLVVLCALLWRMAF